MAQCTYCKAETEMYYGEMPICIQCAEGRQTNVPSKPPTQEQAVRTVLVNHIVEATARVNGANRAFSAALGQNPSGLPDSEGVQSIQDASHELSVARKEMMTAHTRLNEFIERGIVPEDLKRSG